MAIPTKFDYSVGRRKNPDPKSRQQAKSLPTNVGSSIATAPPKQRPNTDKFNPASQKLTENCELTVTTEGQFKTALPYDQIKENGVKITNPIQAESYVDQSYMIPQWTPISGYSLDDKDALTDQKPINHGKDINLTQGFHKQPMMHVHTPDEMTAIRSAHTQTVTSDGYSVDVAPNTQVTKPLRPTSTSVYGGKVPTATTVG